MFITIDYSEIKELDSWEYPEINEDESEDDYYKRVAIYEDELHELVIKFAPIVFAIKLGIHIINLPPYSVDFDGQSAIIDFN
jgi:hypothetical protein